jgi:hypothetical protein
MAVEVKVAPDERLEYTSVFLEDRRVTSQYFNLTELPDTFTGGKNAFLIAGTDYLEPNTEVLVQIRDASGKVVYTESSDGNPEYYEGISKVIAVYVYPTDSVEQAIDSTAFGPCTITILGELKFYDNNGSKTEVPEIWKGRYNVRYIGQANINPNLANTTRVRFFRRPQATITELLKPIYSVSGSSSVSASSIIASYANIKLSRLDTFAGDVKRVKVYRSSASTVSDFELIQDIQIEAKELLQTLNASGSVVTDTGFFNSEVLLNFWDSGSLSSATLNTAHFGGQTAVKLNGAGNFTHKPLLELSQNTVYELAFDAFYTGSAQSDLEIHISSSTGGDRKIDTLVGLFPTKDFTNYVTQFSLTSGSANAYDSSSLYFKQTQDNWYLKDISLRASSETVFSPNEVSFIISMPTNISNETFNFKFEFFDVNNNYIPVAVTGSQTFVGGNSNVGNIAADFAALSGSITILSSSVSGSLTQLSQSVSGTISFTSQSVSGTIAQVSSSLSSSISSSISSSYSSSVYLAESASFALSASLSSSVHTVASFLDERIFTNSSGSLIKPPKTGSAGLYTSNTHLGYHANGVWRTYMSDNGSFYLTSSIAGGGFLAWDAADATLQIQGSINVTGGNAATQTYANTAATNVSSSLAPSIFTDSSGRIRRPPTITPATSGLYISSTNLGYYNGSRWKTYMADNGNFYLDGATGSLSWIADTDTLEINGVINVIGGNAATQTYANNSATTAASSSQAAAISQASTYVTQLANANWTAGDGTFISGRQISAPVIAGTAGYISSIFKVGQNGITLDGTNNKIYVGSGSYANANTPFYFASGSTNIFSLGDKFTWDGTTLGISGSGVFSGNITASGGTFTGFMTAGTAKIGTDVSGSEDGIWLDGNNYWYAGEAKFRMGTTNTYLTYDSNVGAPAFYAASGPALWVTSNNTNAGFAALYVNDGGLRVANTSPTSNGGDAIYAVGRIRCNSLLSSGNVIVSGSVSVVGDITSQASDKRLKENVVVLTSALDKVDKINGVYFNFTDEANKLNGNLTKNRQIGFLAQEIQAVLPEIVKPAPFDIDGNGDSISGENYLTIQYEKVVPLLLQAIKELKSELDEVKKMIK